MLSFTSMFSLLASLSLPIFVQALPPVSSTQYFTGLGAALSDAGFTHLLNALQVANQTANGQALLSGLYSDGHFTLYAPVDEAWEKSNLDNPQANDDLVSLLSYHIATATLNSSSDIAPARHHTVALTGLRNPTVLLPGNQTQVIVLETAPNATTGAPSNETTILVRQASDNVTSTGPQISYQNLYIQPVDAVFKVPSPLLDTLSSEGLAIEANEGANSFVGVASSLYLNSSLELCHGCTFFVPVNAAWSNFTGLNSSEQVAVYENHVLNGTVLYSPRISNGGSYITAGGQTISYVTNSTGGYFLGGGHIASIIRADIPVSNGVVHLIDNILLNTNTNPSVASSAVSAATAAATGVEGGVAGTVGLAPTSSAATASSYPTSTTGQQGAADRSWSIDGAAKAGLVAAVFGALWL